MAGFEHTAQCNLNHSKWMRLKADYVEKWPDYCTKCDGWGSISYDYDPSAAGVSLGSGHMTEVDPCAYCFEKEKCPRCAKPLPELFDPAICPYCGWMDGKTVGIPEAPECHCHEQYT